MPTPCINGTYIERMNDAIVFSEAKRVRVAELATEIGDQARVELIELYRQRRAAPPSEAMLNTVADAAIDKDVRWKTAVGDEQWGGRLTTMYALAEIALTSREQTLVLKAIFEELREANALTKTVIMVTRQHEDLLKTQIVDQRRLLAEQRTTNELLKMLVGQLSVPTGRTNPPAPPQRTGGAPVNTIDPDNPHPAGW